MPNWLRDLGHGALGKIDLPEDRKEQKPFRNVPSLLLGQMARDSDLKGKGVGKIMADFALKKAYELAQEVGCRFIVDSERDKESRYRLYGFESIPPKRAKAKTVLMFFDLGLRKESVKQ